MLLLQSEMLSQRFIEPLRGQPGGTSSFGGGVERKRLSWLVLDVGDKIGGV